MVTYFKRDADDFCRLLVCVVGQMVEKFVFLNRWLIG